MLNRIIKGPLFMVLEGRRIWLGVFISLVVIIGVAVSRLAEPEIRTDWGSQPSKSVEAAIPNPDIQFQAETLRPNLSDKDYFVNYRLKREQYRQETKAMLAELLNSTVLKSREKAQEQWLELNAKQQNEDEIENLLKIKGFQDAVADVFPENVTVIVCAPGLTPDDYVLIQDIVAQVTKIKADKITISSKK